MTSHISFLLLPFSFNCTLHFSETFGEVTIVKNLSDILSMIKIYHGGYNLSYVHNLDQSVFMPYFPGIRAKLDLNGDLQGKNLKTIEFVFKNSDEYSVEVQIDDKTGDTHRPLFMNKIRQKGSPVKLKKNESFRNNYFVTISQEIFSEDDQSKECKNYPNEMFESYNECDEAYVQSTSSEIIQTYCPDTSDNGVFAATFVPIYATHNISLVTEFQKKTKCSYMILFDTHDLMAGATASHCPTPCTTTTTNTILTKSNEDTNSVISLYFDKSVMITNVTVDNFQPMVSLNFLGSNLGLWPGLGICQLFEWLFDNILNRIRIQYIVGQIKAKMAEKILNGGN
jgi:hypothetical protein